MFRLVDVKDLRIVKRFANNESNTSRVVKFDIQSFKQNHAKLETVFAKDLLLSTASLEFRVDGDTFGIKKGPLNVRENEPKQDFPLLLTGGRISSIDTDVQSHNKAQALLNNWAKESGIMEDSELWRKLHTAKIPYMSAYHCPGMRLENVKEMLLLNLISLVLEDTFGNYKESGMSYEGLTDAVQVIAAICRGETYDEKFITGPFSTLCKLCDRFRAKIVSMDRGEAVLNAVVEYIDMNAWELDGWWKEATAYKKNPTKFYFFRRGLTHGFKMRMELYCVYMKIEISDKLRRDPLFALLVRQWARICVITEDILSISSCIEQNQQDNCVLIRARKKTTQVALEKALGELRAAIRDSHCFESQLNVKFEDTPIFKPLQKFYKLGKLLVDAQYQYLITSGKYDTFDIVVDVN